jgi:hypothetical protein
MAPLYARADAMTSHWSFKFRETPDPAYPYMDNHTN